MTEHGSREVMDQRTRGHFSVYKCVLGYFSRLTSFDPLMGESLVNNVLTFKIIPKRRLPAYTRQTAYYKLTLWRVRVTIFAVKKQ